MLVKYIGGIIKEINLRMRMITDKTICVGELDNGKNGQKQLAMKYENIIPTIIAKEM